MTPAHAQHRTYAAAAPALGQRGFSLAELAITLVLIGLLVSLIIMGDGMIVQARTKAVVNDIEGLKIAVITYVDRYTALPGDDPVAGTRWTGKGLSGTGDGRLSGSYQDVPPVANPMTMTVDPAGGETLNFWWHLRLAQIIVAPPDPYSIVAQPLNRYGGVLGVQWGGLGFPRLAACTANLPGDVAIGVENQIDDGQPRNGLIRAAQQNALASNEALATAIATIQAYTAGPDDQFILCRRID